MASIPTCSILKYLVIDLVRGLQTERMKISNSPNLIESKKLRVSYSRNKSQLIKNPTEDIKPPKPE